MYNNNYVHIPYRNAISREYLKLKINHAPKDIFNSLEKDFLIKILDQVKIKFDKN